MDRKLLVSLLNSVTKSEAYFRHERWRGRRHCPWCNKRKIYHLSDGKFRCSRCRKLFTEFSGTYLSGTRIPANDIVYTLEMFCMGVPAYRILRRSHQSRYAVQRLYRLFRQAIYDSSINEMRQLSGSIEMDEAMVGGHRAGKRGWGAEGKTIVFGIYQRNGRVVVFPVPNRKQRTLESLIDRHTKRGSIYYTDDYEGYVGLKMRGTHVVITKEKGRPMGRDHINGTEGFWSYAKTGLYHLRGIPKTYFHLYLKEMEFRFNNRDKDLFDETVKLLLSFALFN